MMEQLHSAEDYWGTFQEIIGTCYTPVVAGKYAYILYTSRQNLHLLFSIAMHSDLLLMNTENQKQHCAPLKTNCERQFAVLLVHVLWNPWSTEQKC